MAKSSNRNRSRTTSKRPPSRRAGSKTTKRGGGTTKTRATATRAKSGKSAGRATRAKSSKRTGSVKRASSAKRGMTRSNSAKRRGGPKVGQNLQAAEHFADQGDFGVEQDNLAEQRRKSDEIRQQPGGTHRGSRQARAGTESRVAGVGGQEGGAGSFSGGDVDVEITGVGDEGDGLAESGPDEETLNSER